jgi:hypothetical protein
MGTVNEAFATEIDPVPVERPVRVSTLAEQGREDDLRDTTADERVGMMWQLALDAWAFMGEPVVEPRLPRHIVRVLRRGS